jgi:hypothetical protein
MQTIEHTPSYVPTPDREEWAIDRPAHMTDEVWAAFVAVATLRISAAFDQAMALSVVTPTVERAGSSTNRRRSHPHARTLGP